MSGVPMFPFLCRCFLACLLCSHIFKGDSNSVVDPDPQGSETFCRIRIRMDPDPDSDQKLDLNLTKNHPKN
jgi:hypothetical protein